MEYKSVKRQFYRFFYGKNGSIITCSICLILGIFVCTQRLELPEEKLVVKTIDSRSTTQVPSKKPENPALQVFENSIGVMPVPEIPEVPVVPILPPVDHKMILFWNPNDKAIFKSHDPFNTVRDCGALQCFLTTNHSLLQRAGAVVLSGYPRQLQRTELPKYRHPQQRYVYYSPEAPDKGKVDEYAKHEFNWNYINWTMTYRSDSSIHVPYGGFTERAPTERISDAPFWAMIRSKKKQVAYWVSRCNNTEDRRYRLLYAKELQKYISVDIYGDCGPFKCGSMFEAWKCADMLKKDYKFYLSFENSICNEYVTEKFFGRMQHLIIPVVLRGSDASKVAPSQQSFIAADAFPNVKKLAEYLLEVDKDENLLHEHLKWYKDIRMKPTDHWCELCRAMNDPNRGPSVIPDLLSWIKSQGECVAGYAQSLLNRT